MNRLRRFNNLSPSLLFVCILKTELVKICWYYRVTLLIVLVDLDQTYAIQILIVDGTGIVLRECVHQIVTVQLLETQRVQVMS